MTATVAALSRRDHTFGWSCTFGKSVLSGIFRLWGLFRTCVSRASSSRIRIFLKNLRVWVRGPQILFQLLSDSSTPAEAQPSPPPRTGNSRGVHEKNHAVSNPSAPESPPRAAPGNGMFASHGVSFSVDSAVDLNILNFKGRKRPKAAAHGCHLAGVITSCAGPPKEL